MTLAPDWSDPIEAAAPPAPPRWLAGGDAAVTIEFGRALDPRWLARVTDVAARLALAREQGALPGVEDIVPTFRSITLLFDPQVTDVARLRSAVEPLLDAAVAGEQAGVRTLHLPVCHAGDCAPDLADVAGATGLAPEDVIARHHAATYTVGMMGFIPGFAFMAGVPPELTMPRRREPRLRVPAGSLGMTGPLTAIYPWASPGGWQLIGRCPVPLFDARKAQPALLRPGDRVRFVDVGADEFERCSARAAAAALPDGWWLEGESAVRGCPWDGA